MLRCKVVTLSGRQETLDLGFLLFNTKNPKIHVIGQNLVINQLLINNSRTGGQLQAV